MLAVGLTAAGVAIVSVQFFLAAGQGLARTRVAACQALRPDPVPAFLANVDAPDFDLTDGEGKRVSLRSQRGHPVLLNFWATWCPPCAEEMPSMERLAAALESSDIRTMAVSVDENWDLVKKFFARGTHLGILLDPTRDVPKRFGTEKFPETFLIDAQGRVRHYFISTRDWSRPEVIACLESLR
ncbi:MAG TPA: TlpA disulfide reductase family protein [Polyangia bacterium]|jgi:thiol-disulfide isomerase/thioredoxin